MPDQPSGRGMKLQANIVKSKVESLKSKVPVTTPSSLRLDSKKYGKQAQKFKERIEEVKPDICIVVAY